MTDRDSLKQRLDREAAQQRAWSATHGVIMTTTYAVPPQPVLDMLDEIHAMLWKLTGGPDA